MNFNSASLLVWIAALASTGCAVEATRSAEGQLLAGWYREHAGKGVFQVCGDSKQLSVSGSGQLRAEARKFGLQQDSPVYARLFGVLTDSGSTLQVSRVEQFGSTTPVRDCAMTGVVIPDSTTEQSRRR